MSPIQLLAFYMLKLNSLDHDQRLNKEEKISSKLLIQPTLQRDNFSSLKDAIPA